MRERLTKDLLCQRSWGAVATVNKPRMVKKREKKEVDVRTDLQMTAFLTRQRTKELMCKWWM